MRSDRLLQTAEIITLLYEDAQTPNQNTEPPALNPTGGVTVKAPLANLVFRKDNSRPGGGVFIAHDTPKDAVDKNIPEGTIIHAPPPGTCASVSPKERASDSYRPAAAPQQDSDMLGYSEPSQSFNMNPSLTLPPGHVHVMNMNILPQFSTSNNNTDQFTLTDPGILDTIPAQLLYEWSECPLVASQLFVIRS